MTAQIVRTLYNSSGFAKREHTIKEHRLKTRITIRQAEIDLNDKAKLIFGVPCRR